jgi:hypothetical protein
VDVKRKNMRILFDVFLKNPKKVDNMTLDEQTLIEAVSKFVEDRLRVLEDEIDAEENSDPNSDCCIIVELLRKRISYFQYSPALTEKMKSCFTEKDGPLLWEKVTQAFNYLN